MKNTKIEAIINEIKLPVINIKFNQIGSIVKITNLTNGYEIYLEINIPAKFFSQDINLLVTSTIKSKLNVTAVKIICNWKINPILTTKIKIPRFTKIKNTIAISSGKGGVGKSTTAANIALALSREGAKVGILDADVFGPSMGLLFGIESKAQLQQEQNCFYPIIQENLKIMSIAFLIPNDSPVVWRGPMASRMLLQMINNTIWGDLDYLIIDLPPGTGDIPLTLAQKVPISTSIFITTAQKLAVLDVQKSIEMFQKVSVNILGVIENMSDYLCSHCGNLENIFGTNGGEQLASKYNIDFLGNIPLSIELCQTKKLEAHTNKLNTVHDKFRNIALNIAAKLAIYDKNSISADIIASS